MVNHLVFCTLFNSYYLDRGLLLYNSLRRVSNEFVLYILAMDDKTFDILDTMNLLNVKLVPLSEFETAKLIAIKQKRSLGEYCFICAPSLIKYVLDVKDEKICTYIDADMAFYSNPEVLFSELKSYNAEVLVVGHRFSSYEKRREKNAGKYCVEFNTFTKTERSLKLLNDWVKKSYTIYETSFDGINCDDQIFLNNWTLNSFVHEIRNLGAGVAPWNISQYKLLKYDYNEPYNYTMLCKKKQTRLIFYHFENINYLNDDRVNINVYYYPFIDDFFVNTLYKQYINELKEIRSFLYEKFDISFILKTHPAKKINAVSKMEIIKSSIKNYGIIAFLIRYFSTKFNYNKNFLNLS